MPFPFIEKAHSELRGRSIEDEIFTGAALIKLNAPSAGEISKSYDKMLFSVQTDPHTKLTICNALFLVKEKRFAMTMRKFLNEFRDGGIGKLSKNTKSTSGKSAAE